MRIPKFTSRPAYITKLNWRKSVIKIKNFFLLLLPKLKTFLGSSSRSSNEWDDLRSIKRLEENQDKICHASCIIRTSCCCCCCCSCLSAWGLPERSSTRLRLYFFLDNRLRRRQFGGNKRVNTTEPRNWSWRRNRFEIVLSISEFTYDEDGNENIHIFACRRAFQKYRRCWVQRLRELITSLK